MADQLLGELRGLDQRVEVDAGVDAHLAAGEHQILGADVAGRTLVPGEGAAAEAADRGVELRDAHLHRRDRVGDRAAAGVVQMQLEVQLRPFVAHLADHGSSSGPGVPQPIVSASERLRSVQPCSAMISIVRPIRPITFSSGM